jgi:hypothetical protein
MILGGRKIKTLIPKITLAFGLTFPGVNQWKGYLGFISHDSRDWT